MQKVIVLFCVMAISLFLYSENVNFSQKDKQLHAGGSFLLCQSGMIISQNNFQRYVLSPGLSFGIGYAKERTDKRYNTLDIKADLVGIGSALVIDSVFRFGIIPVCKKIFD